MSEKRLEHYIDKAEMEQLHYFAHLLYLENLDYREDKKYTERKTRRIVTEEDKEEMFRLSYHGGLTAEEIGARFEMHASTAGRCIREMKKKYGIKIGRNGKYLK